MMKRKYLWPVLLGLAAGCGGSAATDGGEGAGEATTATEGSGAAAAETTESTEGAGETAEAAKPAAAPVERPDATDFEINDLAGNPVTLSGLKGKVVALVFWGID